MKDEEIQENKTTDIYLPYVDNVYTAVFPAIKSSVQIERYQAGLYEALPDEISRRISWVPPELLCMQILFLGNIAEEYVEVITDILEAVADTNRIYAENTILKTIHEQDGTPRVLTLSFDPFPEKLEKLINNIRERIIDSGYKDDSVSVFPHITLGRIPAGLPPFMTHLENIGKPDFPVVFNEVVLASLENGKNRILKGISLNKSVRKNPL